MSDLVGENQETFLKAVGQATFRWPLWIGYLVAIIVGEVFVIEHPSLGLTLFSILAFVLLILAGVTQTPDRSLLVALSLIPIVRVSSLAMPLGGLPLPYWYPITSLPVLVAAVIAAANLGLSRSDLGLRLGHFSTQLGIATLGIPLGFVGYLILRPAPLTAGGTWINLVLLAFMFLFCTGFVEEFVFRGVLQAAAIRRFGKKGLVFVNAVLSSLQIGNQSVTHLALAFCVGVVFSLLVARTRSILGVSLAHGLANFALYAAVPMLLAQSPFN